MAPRLFAVPELTLCFLLCIALTHGGGDDFGLQAIPKGVDTDTFINQTLVEPRHAVAVVSVPDGSKRHLLLKELAADDQVKHVLTFAVQFVRSGSSLVVHRYQYPTESYTGKWTRSAIRAWLLEVGYPLVNRMNRMFAPMKYLTEAAFGTVLVVKMPDDQTEELAQTLETYADRFKHKLKFTFFTKASGTQLICEHYGIWSNDELLLLEVPSQVAKHDHSHVPTPPKYRLENLTPERLEEFFNAYAAGTWPRYYTPKAPRGPPVMRDGIRELTSWDFSEVVNDPSSSVLVAFVSAGCVNCDDFASAYVEVARRIEALKQKARNPLRHVVIARIDHSVNEHSETIKGTPWMRYWARGRRKRPVDVELRSVEHIMNYLEEHAADEADAEL